MKESVITTGGDDGNNSANYYEMFNPATYKVSKITKMRQGRSFPGSVVLDGVAYVCGGKDDKNNELSSCECYRTGVWDCAGTMLMPRQMFAMAVYDSTIYAIGGTSKDIMYLNTVERYNPTSNRWARMNSMQTERIAPSAAILKELLYVCGGYDATGPLSSCETYDPKTQGTWVFISSMNDARNFLNLVVAENCLFAVSGDASVRSVEKFDLKKGHWTRLEKKLLEPRAYSSAILLP